MDKIIKTLLIGKFFYELGYDIIESMIFPSIKIYNRIDGECIGKGCKCFDDYKERYFYDVQQQNSDFSFMHDSGYVNSIDELFRKLNEELNIPEKVKFEFEKIYLLYKLNDFKDEIKLKDGKK